MSPFLGWILAALWLGWLVYWVASAGNVKSTARTTGWQQQLGYSVPLWIAAALLIDRHWPLPLSRAFLPHALWLAGLGLLLAIAGIAFTVWARLHLGANWSAEVTVKHGHELVQSGPYAIVRHPIYAGLTMALLGTAIAIGEWRGVIALVVAVASFWYKLSIEERVMRETFGAVYDDYARRVKALVPFLI